MVLSPGQGYGFAFVWTPMIGWLGWLLVGSAENLAPYCWIEYETMLAEELDFATDLAHQTSVVLKS